MEGAARALAGAPWPEGFASALAREIDTLVPEPGARYAVRSSASIEDEASVLAAGVFLSRVDVARVEVLEAVRAVLGSALSPAVVAYLAQHGLATDNVGFAVLIHEFIEGEASGAAAFDPSRPELTIVEVQTGKAGVIENGARARIEEAVRALAKIHGAVELEWVASGQQVTFLQLRPLQAPGHAACPPVGGAAVVRSAVSGEGSPTSTTPTGTGTPPTTRCRCRPRKPVWSRWSTSSARSACASAWSAAICSTRPIRGRRRRRSARPTPCAACGRRRGERLARPTPTLEQALETFVAIYQPLFGVVQPNSRAATRRAGGVPAPQRLRSRRR